jgi:hypothetical protein
VWSLAAAAVIILVFMVVFISDTNNSGPQKVSITDFNNPPKISSVNDQNSSYFFDYNFSAANSLSQPK